MPATISYIAALSRDPEPLARFYAEHLGLVERGRSPEGDITLTDGFYTLALFRLRRELGEPNMAEGWNRIGIAVDSLAETEARYRASCPRGTVVRESGAVGYGELRIYDPECKPISLSERNFGLAAGKPPALPRIAHMALNALDPETSFDFYRAVFGFRELRRAHEAQFKKPGYRNRHVGDGHSNMAIQAFYNDRAGHEGRFGIAHIGFLVGDMEGLTRRIRDVATVTERPADRAQSEIRMRDPQGNGCDLSRRGWEVDTDKWARAEMA
jgi:catechol 2,3-dioxygenase-like lactoylglutathione lyase family enzyme